MADTALTPIDYTSRSYSEIRQDLIDAIPSYLPEWTNRTASDFGIVLLSLFSYVGDILNYNIDRIANEAFLATAVQRRSVLNLAQLIDYTPTGLAAASTSVTFTIDSGAPGNVTIPAGTKVSTVPEVGDDPIVFETDAQVIIAPGASSAVAVTEGITRSEDSSAPVGVSNGAADQTFNLYYTSIIDGSLSVFVDEDGAGSGTAVEWVHVSHLIDAASDERVYTTTTDENGVVTVIFGDNVNGRIPTSGAIVTATYRTGVGSDGNVGVGTILELVNPITGVNSVSNATAASGGADVESIESIKANAPASLRTINRAVNPADYAALALQVPGVARANATATVYTNITLWVAPASGGAPSSALKTSVETYLNAGRKMATASVTVTDPTYVPINVTLNLVVLDQYLRTAVELAVKNAITGLFDLTVAGFAERVTLSKVYRAIQSVEGVDYATLSVLSTSGSGLADIQLAANEIPTVGTISVTSSGGILA